MIHSRTRRNSSSEFAVTLLIISLLIAGSLTSAAPIPSTRGDVSTVEPDRGTVVPKRLVVRIYVNSRAHLDAIAGRLDIWEAHPEEKYVVAALNTHEYHRLDSLGYRLEIDAEKTARLNVPLTALDPRFYYFDNNYPNPNSLYVEDFMQTTHDAYPTLTELFDIGEGWEATHGGYPRDLWVLRITNEDPTYGAIEAKPVFFLFATIHAREVATAELAIRYIQYLTSGYNTDPDVTWLVNHNVAYLLVMQNPDGHRLNEVNTASSRRKNTDSDDGCFSPTLWGVDLNRNHSFLWGCCGGSSGSACDTTYRGPAPASEPETQAFQNFFTSVVPDQNGPNGDNEIPPAAPDEATGILISLHSYGELVLWPWELEGYPDTPNAAQLQTIGRKFASYNGYDPSGVIWYAVDGATDDWTYGKFGVASYTFEVGPNSGSCGGFFPAFGCIDGIDGQPNDFWAENKPAFLYAHKIARTPYLTVYGPDTENVIAEPAAVTVGEPLQLSANVADHRYPGDPLQPIAAAEYFVDFPGADGTGIPLSPGDGTWGGMSEAVQAQMDTSGLSPGQHYILVHGENQNGQWGPFSAVFFTINMPLSTIDLNLLTTGELYTGELINLLADFSPDNATTPYTYTVDFGDSSQPSTGSTNSDPFYFSHTFPLTGTFTTTFSAWNLNLVVPVTDTVTLDIGLPPYQFFIPLVIRH